MKSAYELAMEKLEKSSPTKKLSPAILKEIEELDSVYKAKIAERETFLQAQIDKARSEDLSDEVAMLRNELACDLKSIRSEWEQKKEKVRTAK